MKRNGWLILIALVLVLVILTGCTQSAPAPSSATKTTSATAPSGQAKILTFVGSNVGGSAQSVVIAMGEMWTNLITSPSKVKVMVEPCVSNEENLKRLDRGEVDLAWTPNAYAFSMSKGINMFKAYGKRGFYALYWGSPALFQVATMDPNIKAIKDVKGKRISGSRPGSTPVEEATLALLAANGMTKDDAKIIPHTTVDDAYRQVKEGTADIGMTFTGFPAAVLTELTANNKIYFLPLNDQEIAAIQKVQPWLGKRSLPAGTYKGMDKDVPSVSATQGVMTQFNFDQDLAYALVKALFENSEKFYAYHQNAKEWTLQSAVSEFIFPFAPGAIKYYKEKGVWTSEMDSKQKALLAEWGK